MKAVRGMQDLYGESLRQWKQIEGLYHRIFSAFGYEEVRTPAVEAEEVFHKAVGAQTDIVEKQMFRIVDQGGEAMVLRPEGTAALVRAVAEHQLQGEGGSQKYYYYGPMYRYERPQKGRLRQFFQWGAEFLGSEGAEADAEVIGLLDHLLRQAGVPSYSCELNSLGCVQCKPAAREALLAFLRPLAPQLCASCQGRLERAPLRVLDCKNAKCQELTQNAPSSLDSLCGACAPHFEEVQKLLQQLGVPYVINPRIVRGLDYYERTAFEFTSTLLGAQSALGAGGRYDSLGERFGLKQLPGVGFAIGMERVLLALPPSSPLWTPPFVFFAALGKAAHALLFPIAWGLRKQGVRCALDSGERSLKNSLKRAAKVHAPFTVILGEEEIQKGIVLLKDMEQGAQEQCALSELTEAILRRYRAKHP